MSELAPEQLRRVTNPTSLGFETTATVPEPQALVGQARAQEAIEFALEMHDARYNLYVAGPPGAGRLSALTRAVQRVAATRPPAHDWVYVYNFEQANEPVAIGLPAGGAHAFAHDVDTLVVASRRELRRAFSDDSYTQQRTELVKDIEQKHGELLDDLLRQAIALGFLIQGTPSGFQLTPLKLAAQSATSPDAQRAEATPAPQSAPESDAATTSDATPSRDVAPSAPSDDGDGDALMSQEEYNALPDEVRAQLDANEARVEAAINTILPQVHELEEEARARVRRLDRAVAEKAITRLAHGIVARYAATPKVTPYLRSLQADIVAHADVLRAQPDDDAEADKEADARAEILTNNPDTSSSGANTLATAQSQPDGPDGDAADSASDGPSTLGGGDVPTDEGLRDRPTVAALLRRYKVNVLTPHKSDDTAPVVQEINPTYVNLLGRIEFGLRQGLPYTDHMMIKPGALHRANGGFLILQAGDLISYGRSWDALRRVLRFGLISIEGSEELQMTPGSATIRPEPIAADLKVILVGDLDIYAALLGADPEFRQIFKVRADFDDEMPRNAEGERYYAQVAGQVARATQGPPLTNEAVALLIEEGSRWAEDQAKLTTQISNVRDLALEACYWAKKDGATTATRVHMAKAIVARERRQSLISDKLDEEIFLDEVMIATEGRAVGQLNGLTIMQTGDYSFGKPTRITARVAPGLNGVVAIEREIEQSGPSHSKGVLILAAYLTGRFAQDLPLSLSASLTFEQTYGPVDGDSASSSELYALLSALSGAEIKQCFAVTGSVNQLGQVQAIGGANHKIEGFYKICRARGLTGEQGVIIPRANVRQLMLRGEVVEAVRAGTFHIHAVSTIDEGIEILTGIPAGRPGPDGRYLEGTINARVGQTLRGFSERVHSFGLAPALATRYVG